MFMKHRHQGYGLCPQGGSEDTRGIQTLKKEGWRACLETGSFARTKYSHLIMLCSLPCELECPQPADFGLHLALGRWIYTLYPTLNHQGSCRDSGQLVGEAQVLTSCPQRTFQHWHLQGKQQGLATGVAESKLQDQVQLDSSLTVSLEVRLPKVSVPFQDLILF